MTETLDHLRGYALVFGSLGQVLEGFVEVVHNSAELKVSSTAIMNSRHFLESSFAFASDRSLRVWTDKIGLAFEAAISLTAPAIDVRNTLMAGIRLGVSVTFTNLVHGKADGDGVRPVKSAGIREISILENPAYPATACWLASTEVGAMSNEVASLARRWRLGQIEKDVATQMSAQMRRRKASARADASQFFGMMDSLVKKGLYVRPANMSWVELGNLVDVTETERAAGQSESAASSNNSDTRWGRVPRSATVNVVGAASPKGASTHRKKARRV